MSEEERYEVLSSLSFMELCGPGRYRVIGTSYVYFMWDRVWSWDDDSDWRIVSFEEVFDAVDNDIRGEMVFHLDLLIT